MEKGRLRINLGIFVFGIVGLITILVLDKYYFQTKLLSEDWPNFSAGYIIRSVLIFIFVSALVISAIRISQPSNKKDTAKWGAFENISIWGTLTTSTIFTVIFLVNPYVFSSLCREDGIIEWGSAIMLIGSSIIFLGEFLANHRKEGVSRLFQWTNMAFMIGFFVIAMEEISWFQRILEIETPGFLNRNLQYELNFHNFSTNPSENVYYFGAFLFLVMMPVLKELIPKIGENIKILIPQSSISVIGAVACAYNFDMWNILFTQVAFFGSVIVIIFLAINSKEWGKRITLLSTVILIVVTQILFLANGENFTRLWDITEYKEFFIPLAFLIYSVSVKRNRLENYPKKANPT